MANRAPIAVGPGLGLSGLFNPSRAARFTLTIDAYIPPF
jgi:hypothetical protein